MKLAAAFAPRSTPSKSRNSQNHNFSPDTADRTRKRHRDQGYEHTTLPITPEKTNTHLDCTADNRSKIFNDPIHGGVELDEICLRIVDTAQFKRLKGLKQLGVCDHVFPSATHTRFEHSLGVAHLAGKLAKAIRDSQPHLSITNADITCLQIAGLCHDLGHGPYSHVFDGVFIKRLYPSGIDEKKSHWRHEDGSVRMFKELLEKNNIDFKDFKLNSTDQLFVEEIIQGIEGAERKGRGHDKIYLYDIVNNTRSGLDVDKIDYFLRDSQRTNVSAANISVDRLFQNCRVLEADTSELVICYPEKMIKEAVDFFQVRFNMHQSVYTHKVVKAVEYMLTDALVLANDHVFISGTKNAAYPDGRYKMSQCIHDMTALSRLKDSIVDIINHDLNPQLQAAKDILRRIDERKLYTCLGKVSYSRSSPIHKLTEQQIEDSLLSMQAGRREPVAGSSSSSKMGAAHADASDIYNSSHYEALDFKEETEGEFGDADDSFLDASPEDSLRRFSTAPSYSKLSANDEWGSNLFSQESQLSAMGDRDPILEKGDLIPEKMHIHFGLKDSNPVDRMRFFAKPQQNEVPIGKKIDESVYESSLPRKFEELSIRVFCRDPQKARVARKAFELWCKLQSAPAPYPTCSQPCESPYRAT